MKTLITSNLIRIFKAGVLMLALLAGSKTATQAADISWIGGTDSYTNPAAWSGGIVPGVADNAINSNGTNNVVQINAGNPDWFLNQLIAGNGAGDGAYSQSGQAVNLNPTPRNFRLGVAAGSTGIYTISGGSINYTNGGFNIGELGTGVMNMSGGVITGIGNLAVNLGTGIVPNALTASMDGGTNKTGFTWFEQGLYTPNTALGVPAAGSTFVSTAQPDHSYTMASSYTANDAFLVDTNVTSATITLTTPAAYSALSFAGSSGNGAMTLNYTVNHADSTFEAGTVTFPDWFAADAPALGTGGRVSTDGTVFQIQGAGNSPKILSQDITLTNTTSAVTSVNLAYTTGGGEACVLAVSGSTGGTFDPISITGYNEDMIMEAGAVTFVANTVTDILNQVDGTITLTGAGQFFVGNYGNGIYNFSGGTNNVNNFIAIGRSGGNGTVNMAGGLLNQTSSGQNLLVGTGFQAPPAGSVGVLNQSGGTIVCQGQFLCPENSPSTGTYNLTNGVLLVNNWIAFGRNGGAGVLNMSGGSITKTGNSGNHIDVGAGGVGTVNQTGGAITNITSDTWIGESSAGTWNLNGGTANLSVVHIGQLGSSTGTLNVNGGTLVTTEVTSGNNLAVSTLNLNGGTIQASASSANFLHDLILASVQSGGAIFDSQGFNITVPQVLSDGGGGGLTKNGAGVLTLSGANSYVGTTIVNAGTLATTTASTGGGDYTVADSAALGTQVQTANAQLNVANLTVGATIGASLNFDLGNFGNPGASFAPLNVNGVMAVNGTITVNVADALPQLGQFPLIKYGSKTGSGTFTLGSVPTGITASISNNVANNSIDLVITGVNLPRWDGQAGGNWDIGVTTNWVNIGTGLPTFYTEGSVDLFDDNAVGTTTVNLVTTVHPGRVTVTNNILTYTLTGSGKISGSLGLTKQGTAALAIVNTGGNDFTGPVTISGGTLSVTNLANGGSPSAIGASSANQTNLVFAGGKLSYAGSPVSINRGYTVTADGSTLETVSNLTLSGAVRGAGGTFNKAGLGQLTYTGVSSSNVLCDFNTTAAAYQIRAGTVILDGSAGAQTNYSRNTNLGADAGLDPTLILTNTTLVTRSMQLGNNATCTGTVIMNSNSTMTVAANNFAVGFSSGTQSAGVLTQNPGSFLDSTAELWVGQGALGTGTFNMNGGSAIFRSWVAIGRNGGTATFNMTGGTVTKTPNNNFMIGSRDGTTGTRGTLNQSGGSIFCGSEYWIGEAQNNASAAFGTNNISGTATLIVSNWIAIGREGAIGVLNLSGGSVTKLGTSGNHIEIGNGTGSTGTINQTGGAFTNTISETRVGTGAPGFWNMSGGTANLAGLVFCNNAGCTNGTLNLNGGVITATEIRANQTGVANVSTLNWNGGTIVAANGANVNFLHNLTKANVQSGGAVIDSGTNIINVSQPLLDGTGGGGLTKIGNGTLRMNGTNLFTGATLVNVGTLGGTGVISGPVSIATNATLSPGVGGIGNFTISNTVTLASNSFVWMEVNRTTGTNDLIRGVTQMNYNGTLIVSNLSGSYAAGNSIKLFDAASYTGAFSAINPATPGTGLAWNTNQLAVNGTLLIASTVNTNSTNITVVISGGNLNLSWPADHIGWRLQVQTNQLATGLRTNWVDVPNATSTNAVSIPLVPSNPAVFFRMIYP